MHRPVRFFALTAFVVSTGVNAASPSCKPVFDAMMKMAATPNDLHMHRTAGADGPSDSETVTTADTRYIEVNGTWHRTPYDAKRAVAEMRAADDGRKTTCTYLRDENVAGEDSAVYDTRDEPDEGETVDSRIWISKASGLPIKQAIDMDVGGKAGKSHTDVMIEYVDVKAPAGAK